MKKIHLVYSSYLYSNYPKSSTRVLESHSFQHDIVIAMDFCTENAFTKQVLLNGATLFFLNNSTESNQTMINMRELLELSEKVDSIITWY